MQESKTSTCSSCPSFTAAGRCVGHGASGSKIVFLLGPPKENVAEPVNDYIAHRDSIGKLFQQIYDRVLLRNPVLSAAKYFKAHSAQCIVTGDEAESIKHCKSLVHAQIAMSGASVVFAMGSSAMRSMGITGSVDSVRGKVIEVRIGAKTLKVICSYNPGAFYRREQVGLVTTFEQDLLKALKLSLDLTSNKSLQELTKDFILEKTPAGAMALCEKILAARDPSGKPPLLAVDTETTGLETWLPDFRCIAFSFSWGEGQSGAFLYNHREAEPAGWKKILPKLREVLEGPNPKTLHNFQYDYKVIEEALGLKINNVAWDSMLGEYLLDESKQGLYSLENVVKTRVPEFVDYKKIAKDQLSNKKSFSQEIETIETEIDAKKAHEKWAREQKKTCADKDKKSTYTDIATSAKQEIASLKEKLKVLKASEKEEREKDDSYENIPVDDLLLYAAIDTECTRRISVQQVNEIKAEDSGMFKTMKEVLLPAARGLGKMEHEGVKVDLQYLDQLDKEFVDIRKKCEDEINAYLQMHTLWDAGATINLNAAADVIKLLTVKLGLQLHKRTKKDTNFSVNKDVLDELSGSHPLVSKIMEWRKSTKARETFVEGIRESSKKDGRVHTSYRLTGTVTGRLSSSSPNLQNIPARGVLGKNIKKLFIPDNEDEYFINMDYSGAEIRVMTAYAHDKDLIDSLNKGLNIHSFVASEIFDKLKVQCDGGVTKEIRPTYELIESRKKLAKDDPKLFEVLDRARQNAKSTVFLTIYGGGAGKLHENLSKEDPSITLEDCERIIATFLGRFPVIQVYMETIKHQVRTQGYVKSKFGRRRRFPLAQTDWRFRIDAEKEAINFPIQGTSSDLVISQLCELIEHSADIGFKPRLTVHDSIAGVIPKKNIHLLRDFLDKYAEQRITEKFPWMPVPFIYEADYGPSYGECKIEIK